MGSLFDSPTLRLLGREFWPSASKTEKGLELIRWLGARKADGTLAALSETRIEQSFNERLFAETFGYRTLFRDGEANYHLRPKGFNPGNRRYDDFGLGFFRPGGGVPLAVVELKDPGTDLEAPQGGNYKGMSPVAQAHRQADGLPSVAWVIVSNFDEMRLYRRGVVDRFERILLSDVLSANSFARAHTLFSRETLLGHEGQASPLDRTYRGGDPMVVPSRPQRVRLVQSAVPEAPPIDPLPLPKMHAALGSALQGLPKWGITQWLRLHPSKGIEFEEDRLVIKLGEDDRARVEFTNSGVLHVSERIPPDDGSSFTITSTQVIQRHAMFLMLAATTTTLLAKGYIRVGVDLFDLDGATLCPEGSALCLRTQVGVSSTHAPPRQRHLEGSWSAGLNDLVLETAGELLFPFEGRDASGKVLRYLPTKAEIEAATNPVR